jgi:8-oxo-dGTP diphosphatase
MDTYPNYRVAVEAVILHNKKILVTRRADNCAVDPSVWSVPAGKVKYDEIPVQGLIREAREETNLEVEIIRELDVRTFRSMTRRGEILRLMYTYLVKPKHDDIGGFTLNHEHSAFAWVNKAELLSGKYDTMNANTLRIVLSVLENLQR